MKLAVLLLSCTGSPRLTDYDQPWVQRVFDWFQLPQTSRQWHDLGFGAGPVASSK